VAVPTPTWTPTDDVLEHANLTALMRRLGHPDYRSLHRWSVERRDEFWAEAVAELGIVFRRPPDAVLAGEDDPEHVRWLAGARYNIAESCFTRDPTDLAVVARHGATIRRMTFGALRRLVMRVANGYRDAGFEPGHRIAIAMPMNVEAVAAYLGIVWAGGVVVSIADSFAPEEIATRLRIAGADTVVTQDRIVRGGKELPMYEKVVAAGADHAIVVATGGGRSLRAGDRSWDDFLGSDTDTQAVACEPDDPTNVLFSSGTTGDPKAIPWTHLTPIKAASDGRFHHDIHPDDLVAWPTNLGWMMGPWLIYASLLNGAAIALYDDVPTGRGFVEFVRDAGVTVLGVVPSLIAAWRSAGVLDGVELSSVRVLGSTGEASNASDVAWLMNAAGGVPMIDYCGGTELGGAYVTATVVQPVVASMFTTPTLGMDFVLLDDEGRRTNSGEVFLVPPSIGMSQRLFNRDHHQEYYAGVPSWGGHTLRRHGDHIEEIDGGYYQAHGRIDDTMNLGGIKVSSAEIERVVARVPGVAEAAAIASEPPGGGPSRLVVVAVLDGADVDPAELRDAMQAEIRVHLNPLFKIHDVVLRASLPRTASAKVMRRALRAEYAG
jgi:acetyl-CoA synthetase